MGVFLPNPKKKLYFWSYSKAVNAKGCPRKFLMSLYNVPQTEPIHHMTLTGSFLHNVLENIIIGHSFAASVNMALRSAKVVDYFGNFHGASPPLDVLINLADQSVIAAKKFMAAREEEFGEIHWFPEADLRIKKDFTEVDPKYAKSMVRSKKTWFTGAMDLLGITKDGGHALITDFKYYETADADAHSDQLDCYSTVVGAMCDARNPGQLKEIHNYVLFLKQEVVKDLGSRNWDEGRDKYKDWLVSFVSEAKAKAEIADIKRTEPSATNCKYCGYKKNCLDFKEENVSE
jgi:hypothetical protein